jgi:hypothetical protein
MAPRKNESNLKYHSEILTGYVMSPAKNTGCQHSMELGNGGIDESNFQGCPYEGIP